MTLALPSHIPDPIAREVWAATFVPVARLPGWIGAGYARVEANLAGLPVGPAVAVAGAVFRMPRRIGGGQVPIDRVAVLAFRAGEVHRFVEARLACDEFGSGAMPGDGYDEPTAEPWQWSALALYLLAAAHAVDPATPWRIAEDRPGGARVEAHEFRWLEIHRKMWNRYIVEGVPFELAEAVAPLVCRA